MYAISHELFWRLKVNSLTKKTSVGITSSSHHYPTSYKSQSHHHAYKGDISFVAVLQARPISYGVQSLRKESFQLTGELDQSKYRSGDNTGRAAPVHVSWRDDRAARTGCFPSPPPHRRRCLLSDLRGGGIHTCVIAGHLPLARLVTVTTVLVTSW